MKMDIKIVFGILVIALLVGCTTDVEGPVEPTPKVVEPKIINDVEEDSEMEEPVVLVPEKFEETPKEVEITFVNGLPVPIETTIKMGGTVTWNNIGTTSYYILGGRTAPFKSHKMSPGDTFSYTYPSPGTYTYVVSPGKPGKIKVVP